MKKLSKTKRKQPPHAQRVGFEGLSFVAADDGPKAGGLRSWWCGPQVEPSGDWHKDCVRGRALALEYLAYQAGNRNSGGSLSLIAAAMPRNLNGVMTGFCAVIDAAVRLGLPGYQRLKSTRRNEVLS